MQTQEFRGLSPAEFFYRNREIAGFSNPARALYQTVREFVENSLDAADMHGILPSVGVYITRAEENVYTVTVEDNGIGVPPQYIPQAFGQVLFSSKYKLRQSRGMFGLGAKMAILYGQITTGRPVEVYSSPVNSNKIYYFKLSIDIKNNKPIILEQKIWRKSSRWHGTIISVTLAGDWSRAKAKIYEYIRRTAVIAPYAEILFRDPDNNVFYYPRSINVVPRPPKEVKPHPKGIDLEYLKMLINATDRKLSLREFLIKSFQSIGEKTADAFLEFAGFNPNTSIGKLTSKDIERLLKYLQEYDKFKPPRADALSPLGPEVIEAGLKRFFEPDFVKAITRRPSSYQGHPFIVEIGIAYGGRIPASSEPILLRYANKIPLLYDEKTDVAWKIIDPRRFDWRNYKVEFPAPLVVFVHICSTKIPYKGVGKESIAEIPEIEYEIRNGLREVARSLRSYLTGVEKERELERKIITLLRYVPEIARGLSLLAKHPEHTDKAPPQELIEDKLLSIIREKLSLPRITRQLLEKIVLPE